MNISKIEPTQAFSFTASCCQCARLGNGIDPLVEMRALVDGETATFCIHLPCLAKLTGIAADAYYRVLTLQRSKARAS
jgi:hypothetical protein